jgi:hypothetical protein
LLEETTKEVTTDKDNSLLRDDGTNQGLSAEELEALKGSAKVRHDGCSHETGKKK